MILVLFAIVLVTHPVLGQIDLPEAHSYRQLNFSFEELGELEEAALDNENFHKLRKYLSFHVEKARKENNPF